MGARPYPAAIAVGPDRSSPWRRLAPRRSPSPRDSSRPRADIALIHTTAADKENRNGPHPRPGHRRRSRRAGERPAPPGPRRDRRRGLRRERDAPWHCRQLRPAARGGRGRAPHTRGRRRLRRARRAHPRPRPPRGRGDPRRGPAAAELGHRAPERLPRRPRQGRVGHAQGRRRLPVPERPRVRRRLAHVRRHRRDEQDQGRRAALTESAPPTRGAVAPRGGGPSSHDPALRRHPRAELPLRQRRAHPRELRRVAALRAAAPRLVRVPRVVLPVHGDRRLPWPRAVGRELVHRHVHARQLGAHPRQHAVPGDLRQERRGRLRPRPLPRVLRRRRLRRLDDAGARHAARRHRGRRARADARGERRDRGRARRLLRGLSALARAHARLRVPRPDPGVGVPGRLVPLPARRGRLRPHVGEGERRRRRLLRPRRRVRLRLPRRPAPRRRRRAGARARVGVKRRRPYARPMTGPPASSRARLGPHPRLAGNQQANRRIPMFVAPGTVPFGYKLTRQAAQDVARNWWLLLLNGAILVVAGVLIFGIDWTIRSLATFIGALFIFQGTTEALTTGVDARVRQANVLTGLLSIAAGVLIIVWPTPGLLAVSVILGAWLVVMGSIALTGSFAARAIIPDWWLLLLLGLAEVALGVLALANPGATLVPIVTVGGIWAVAIGVMRIVLSFQVKRLPDDVDTAWGDASANGDKSAAKPDDAHLAPSPS